jgi:hypothetical protein
MPGSLAADGGSAAGVSRSTAIGIRSPNQGGRIGSTVCGDSDKSARNNIAATAVVDYSC